MKLSLHGKEKTIVEISAADPLVISISPPDVIQLLEFYPTWSPLKSLADDLPKQEAKEPKAVAATPAQDMLLLCSLPEIRVIVEDLKSSPFMDLFMKQLSVKVKAANEQKVTLEIGELGIVSHTNPDKPTHMLTTAPGEKDETSFLHLILKQDASGMP